MWDSAYKESPEIESESQSPLLRQRLGPLGGPGSAVRVRPGLASPQHPTRRAAGGPGPGTGYVPAERPIASARSVLSKARVVTTGTCVKMRTM